MRALIVYESMYGNTRVVAERIAAGLQGAADVAVVPVADATADRVASVDLLVCGAPTHAHGLPRPSTRQAASSAADKDTTLALEPGASGRGLREWLADLAPGPEMAAVAFDTRMKGPSLFTGRASRALSRRLRRAGATLAVPAASFLVDKHNHLLAGEADRAEAWARTLRSTIDVPEAVGIRPESVHRRG